MPTRPAAILKALVKCATHHLLQQQQQKTNKHPLDQLKKRRSLKLNKCNNNNSGNESDCQEILLCAQSLAHK